MKAFVITLALAGLASTAKLDAQILNRLPVPSTNGSVNVDASWHQVGRDRNGNTIYERRTRDGNGNILVQQAVRDRNGNMTITNSRTEVVNNGRNGNNRNNDCTFSQSTNSVGDIIFGRTSAVNNCDDRNSRVDGGWYQVGRDGNGNRIYERQTRDRNGNVIIQHARRNSNGSFTILNSRVVRNNGRNNGRNNDDRFDNGRGNRDDDKDRQKEQRRRDNENRKDNKHGDDHGDRHDNGHGD